MSTLGPTLPSSSRISAPVNAGHSATSAGTYARYRWAVPTSPAVDAEYLGATAAGANEAEQQSNGGRFPGTVGTEEPEHLARLDGEADVVDGDDLAEPFRQAVDADSELGGRDVHVPRRKRAPEAFHESGYSLPTRLPGAPRAIYLYLSLRTSRLTRMDAVDALH